eukprot:COSAG01_NODE_5609_length_4148_cov_12.547296_2_plen_162_part_00
MRSARPRRGTSAWTQMWSRSSVLPNSRTKYSAAGATILRSMSSHFKVPKKPLEKWLGQIGFAARSAPIVRAWSQVLRSLLPSGWEHTQHVHLSQIAQSTLQFILELLHFEEGTALFYRRAPMTNSTRSVWWRFHDAAKSPCPNGKFTSGCTKSYSLSTSRL